MMIFDRPKYFQHQARAMALLPKANFLPNMLMDELAERLRDVARPFPRVAITGARVNSEFLQFLKSEKGAKSIDVACFGAAQMRHVEDLKRKDMFSDMSITALSVKDDEEILPFTAHSYDLLIDAGHVHHVNDIPGWLIQSRMALHADGLFMAVMAGGDNLQGLKTAMAAVETEMFGGAAPRISPFVPLQSAAGLMQRAGFALPVVDHDRIDVDYRTLKTLYHDLRAMGEASCLANTGGRYRPSSFFETVEDFYRREFGNDDDTLPVRFEFIYLHGWAPHESQQKPMRPGSADTSLTEVL